MQIIFRMLILLALAGSTLNTISACSCMMPRLPLPLEIVGFELSNNITNTYPSSYRDTRVNYVFKGKLISSRDVTPSINRPYMSNRILTFQVEESLFGKVPKRVEVVTSASSASCGWSVSEGVDVVVFASSDKAAKDSQLSTSLCTRNTSNPQQIKRFVDFFRGFRDQATGNFSFRTKMTTDNGPVDSLLLSYNLKEGQLDGPFYVRELNGNPLAKGQFSDGQKVGDWQMFYETYDDRSSMQVIGDTYRENKLIYRQLLMSGREKLPYASIPDQQYSMSAGATLARFCDGLGFRYYWATDSLRAQDIAFRPTPESRSSYETLEHIYGLSEVVFSVALGQASQRPLNLKDDNFKSLRERTLFNLQYASQVFSRMDADTLNARKVRFQSGDKTSEAPIWNFMNGPLSDAIYHTGQIVSFRRISGNPIASGVNVFQGTKE